MKRSAKANASQLPSQRFLMVIAAVGLCLVVCAWWVWSLRDGSSQPRPAPPPLASSPLLNTNPSVRYVGRESCRRCHPEQYASYLETAHSRSLAKVDPAAEPPDGEYDHPLSRRHYRIYRRAGEVRHAESLQLAGGGTMTLVDRPLAYLVGSGRFTRTYLVQSDGFLTESPLTWYASLSSWSISPGYDKADHPSFQREINADCLFCHAGRAEAAGEGNGRLEFHELAIGCERCHGPGSLHAERHDGAAASIPSDGDNSIANPRRLSRELSEAVCHQCHLESAASATVRGRRREDFRPGLRWTDFCVNFAFEQPTGKMTVTGHVEQLHRSRCYQADATLTCITCHDPHQPLAPAERVAHYRAACLACHKDEACKIAAPERVSRNDNDCAACHMPQSPTDIPHIAFTHHRIGIHKAEPVATDESAGRPLTPVLDVSHLLKADRQRTLGLAATRLFADHPNDARYEPYGAQAEENLLAAAAGGLKDPAAETALAAIAAGAGDGSVAETRAKVALRLSGISTTDLATCNQILASQHLQAGRLVEATLLLEQNIQLRLSPQDWFLLGICRQRQHDLAGAIAALERVVEIDPSEPRAYQMLAEWHVIRGDNAKATAARERAKLLEANLPRLPAAR